MILFTDEWWFGSCEYLFLSLFKIPNSIKKTKKNLVEIQSLLLYKESNR